MLKDKANDELHKRLITDEIKPEDFVTMEQEDRMNPTLRKFAEAVRAESIRNSILKVEQGPRIRKTHKGEEYVVDENAETFIPDEIPTAGEIIVSSTATTVDSGKDSKVKEELVSTELWGNGESLPIASTSLDIASAPDAPTEYALDDEYIDSSAVTVWSGTVSMDLVSDFQVSAIHLGGPPNFDPKTSWQTIINMNSSISVDGRLPRNRAGKYLQAVSALKDIITMIMRTDEDGVTPDQPRGYRPKFKALYDYFSTRDKYGVFRKEKAIVKDAYLITQANGEEIPDYLNLSQESREILEHFLRKDKRVIVAIYVVNRSPTEVNQYDVLS